MYRNTMLLAKAARSVITVNLALLEPFRQRVVGRTELRGCLLGPNFI